MNAPYDPRHKVGYRTVVRERGIGYAAAHAIDCLFHEADEANFPLDIDSIRFSLSVPDDPNHEDTVLRVTARVGAPPCPRCHQPGDRPHTDYCPTRCTCPPEQLILGHAARCPVRAADPWHAPLDGIKVRNPTTEPTPLHQCTDPTCPVSNPHAHAGDELYELHLPTPSGLPLDEWAAKHGNQHTTTPDKP